MVRVCKRLCYKHNISYKQALRDASPSYKTRNEVKPEVVIPKQEKPKRTNKKKWLKYYIKIII